MSVLLPVLCLLFAFPAASFPLHRIDKNIDNIFRQNQEWKESRRAEDPNFFSTSGSFHKPNFMWIGCSDARVPANEVMGEDTGSVFVVRNVANMVVNTDFNLMGALQFAVDYLKIPHILVCGHYDCGGIRASMEKKDHVPPLENWLRNIRDVYRLHRVELDAITDPEERHRRLVELNVVEQCINLFKTGVIQRRRVDSYKEGQPYTTPRIHACVFDPKTGDLKRLDVDFYKQIDELRDIYDLYTIDEEEKRTLKSKRMQNSVGFPDGAEKVDAVSTDASVSKTVGEEDSTVVGIINQNAVENSTAAHSDLPEEEEKHSEEEKVSVTTVGKASNLKVKPKDDTKKQIADKYSESEKMEKEYSEEEKKASGSSTVGEESTLMGVANKDAIIEYSAVTYSEPTEDGKNLNKEKEVPVATVEEESTLLGIGNQDAMERSADTYSESEENEGNNEENLYQTYVAPSVIPNVNLERYDANAHGAKAIPYDTVPGGTQRHH